MVAMKRVFALLLMVKFARPFFLYCARRPSFALKWFWPPFRARILPFFVTFSLFEYDLFVFITIVLVV